MIDLSHVPATSGVYCLRNAISGEEYVGAASNLRDRLRNHIRQIAAGNHPSRLVAASVKMHGSSVFDCRVLEECPAGELPNRERHWMKQLKSALNEREGAHSGRGATRPTSYRLSDTSEKLIKELRWKSIPGVDNSPTKVIEIAVAELALRRGVPVDEAVPAKRKGGGK